MPCRSPKAEHLGTRMWPTALAGGTRVSPLPPHKKQPASRHSQMLQEQYQQEGPFITCPMWPETSRRSLMINRTLAKGILEPTLQMKKMSS